MSFLNKENRKIERKRRSLNSSGFYEIFSVITGVLIIILTIIILIDKEKYAKLFSVTFLLAAAMNICMGVKYYKRQEFVRVFALIFAGLFFIVMSVISFMV